MYEGKSNMKAMWMAKCLQRNKQLSRFKEPVTKKLLQILNNTDSDALKERAMPKETRTVRDSQIARMKSMSNSGYSLREIADALGVSPATLNRALE